MLTLEFMRPSYQADEQTASSESSVLTPVEISDLILKVLYKKPSMALKQVAEQIKVSLRAVERATAKLVQKVGYSELARKKAVIGRC